MTKTRITSLFTALLLVMTASAQVLFDGKKPAIDTLTGTWLITVPKAYFGTNHTAVVTLDESVTRCYIDGARVTSNYTFHNIQPNMTYPVQVITGTSMVEANIQFTHWPVVQIYGSFVKRPYAWGTVVYTHPDSTQQQTINSRVRWAGSSTADAGREKHNFHLKFYNPDGSKKDMSFFGLRHDFHWRLDAGQIDFSRVRNRVAKDIWAQFASLPHYASIEPKTPYSYVRGDFVEVFLNDEYMGIYSLNEHMDRQQLKLKKYDYTNKVFHGGLWKPMKWSYITTFYSLADFDANKKNWDEFYMKYPNIDDVKPTNYQTLYDALYFTQRSSDKVFMDSARYYFDIPVFRDFYLFTILLQAPDNVGKNVYYACYDAATDKRLTLAIWDLDCTQGQFWSNVGNNYHNAKVGPEVDFRTEQLSAHKVYKRLWTLDPSFHGLATERYWELRSTTFNPDSIVARYKAYFDEMKSCGADQREITRWNRCYDLGGRELNFDNELVYLRNWWNIHIAYLDSNVFIPYQDGDVNFDHEVNIDDVSALIDYLLYNETNINEYRADYDRDGKINIDDITSLIDVLLSKNNASL